MILSKVQTSAKQRTEFRLLISIRFACLMAKAKGDNPMDCERVQNRISALIMHLAYTNPSREFQRQYVDKSGELGQQFSLRYIEPRQGLYGTVKISENSVVNNIYKINNVLNFNSNPETA